MKRKLRVRGVTVIAFISMVVMFFCVGCGNNSDTDKSTKQETEKKTETLNKNAQKAGETYKLEQGSFVIPKGWKLHEGDSTAEKPFFIPENSDSDNPSGIISVQYMTNHYSKDDSQTLAESILWQLNMQLKGHLSGEVTASGTSRKAILFWYIILLQMVRRTLSTTFWETIVMLWYMRRTSAAKRM